MLGRIEVFFRRLRRAVSRSEWLVTLLRLPRMTTEVNSPGLIMVQIDGLSHSQLIHALEQGKMPFLQRLIKREHYRLHLQYAGLPSTTAAIQGELFYGVKGVVPGFNFLDSASGKLVRMFEPTIAASVERELEDNGKEPLLKDGSSYVNNYTGGAAEPHFCPAALGWGESLRHANPLLVALMFLSNAWSFVRLAVLLVLEFILAIVDLLRGLFGGLDLISEMKFVPTRVAISILLRELATIGTKIDIARGLPIIHLNYLGYDEQAHRRGPSSLFAHWTLKGIDDAIARIWRSAQRSTQRHYDVWIYSDHGQEAVKPYHTLFGRSIEEAVSAVFADLGINVDLKPEPRPNGIQTQRVRQLGGKWIQRLFAVNGFQPEAPRSGQVTVAGLGPIGFVYYDHELDKTTRDTIAQMLATTADVPLVLTADGPDRATAWTASGTYTLPQQNAEVLGAEHPFLEESTQDLITLCHHPDAGNFILCSWRVGATPCSFSTENGAHGGPGPEETSAFALLPGDIHLSGAGQAAVRALDLRNAALHFLGRSEQQIFKQKRTSTADVLRVMTYNVHSCIGMDGKLAPERIARVIARYAPDVVALQELDVGRVRTKGMDQAHLIARYLEMDFHFHPAMHIEEERYGDAILTHLPMRLVKAGALPGLTDKPLLEPRGALWVAIELGGIEYHVMNTHLGLSPRERRVQAEALLGADWLGHPDCRGPVVLCGDFNALPSSRVCRQLRTHLHDAQIELKQHRPRRTFSGRFPAARIDYIFTEPAIEVLDIEVPDTELARVASDHLPLIAELRSGLHDRS